MGKQILLIKLSILTVSANFNRTVRKEIETKTKESFFEMNEPDYSNDFFFFVNECVYPVARDVNLHLTFHLVVVSM